MNNHSTIVIIFGAVAIFLLLLIDTGGKKHVKGCSKTDQIKVTSEYVITYCIDNGKVLIDSTWTEPTNFEKRWIETKKIN